MKPNKTYLSERYNIVRRVKDILISSLNLGFRPEQIHVDEILFGAGLGLDSIDSLQLTMSIKSEFNVNIQDSDMWALRSVNTIVDYIMISKKMLDRATDNRVQSYLTQTDKFRIYNLIRNDLVKRNMVEFVVLKLQGEDELLKLNKLVTRDIEFVPEGSVVHAMVLDNEGTFISDVYFMNNFDHHFLLLPDDKSEKLLNMLISARISYENITSSSSLFSVDGPKADGQIEKMFGVGASSLKPYTFSIESTPEAGNVLIARLDNYGEFGFLILEPNSSKSAFSKYFNNVESLNQVPPEVEQLLWLESCRFHKSICFRNGTENIIEAGLSALVSFEKDQFQGKAATESFKSNKRLVHFRSDSAVSSGDLITTENEVIGYVVTSAFSPLLELYIGNAYIDDVYAVAGINYEAGKNSSVIQLISAPQLIGQSYKEMF